MKVLIWIGCFLIATILNTILGYVTGIKAGYLVFYLVVYFVAKKLCEKWDQRKHKDDTASNADEPGSSEQNHSDQEEAIYFVPVVEAEYNISNINKICFCRKCGERLIDNSRFCRKCGTEIVNMEEE